MKTYLYPNAYTVVLQTPGIYRKVIFLFFLLSVSLLAFSDDNIGLEFRNAQLESGRAGADGAVYRFPQVSNDVDALVTITGRSNSRVRLVNIDLKNTGWDKAFQPQVTCDNSYGVNDWWLEFEISFVEKGKTTPVTVTNFDVTALDIDGNDDRFCEYVSFFNLKSYTVENGSMLKVTNLLQSIAGVLTPGKRFDGATRNYDNIDTSATTVMVTNKYENTGSFRVRAGGAVMGNGASGSNRMFSMYFKTFTYQAPVEFTLPLVLNSFNAALDNKKVLLKWVTGMEKDLSHFVIEKSVNGRDFSDAGVVFANGNSGVKREYVFTDGNSMPTGNVVYYRLKMVDTDMKYQHSAIRMIKMNTTEITDLQLQAYPNPVVSEVRITIPSAWQNKQVTYEVYSLNGLRVKQFTNSTASQTEAVNVSDLGTGVYLIKATTGNESAMQRIIKK